MAVPSIYSTFGKPGCGVLFSYSKLGTTLMWLYFSISEKTLRLDKGHQEQPGLFLVHQGQPGVGLLLVPPPIYYQYTKGHRGDAVVYFI